MRSPAISAFKFDNSYANELEGFFVAGTPDKVPQPSLLRFNRALAEELGLNADALDASLGAAIFSGNEVPVGATPIAQAYAGHQFGGFSPQLGDGRALLLGEVIDRHGRRRDIAFKGSGRTPFSRGGDGKAAVGPMLREYLIGEAMHALGIPTTRALAVAATGTPVMREEVLPGAVLTRVAASHIRVGTFQFFAARGEVDRVRQLADYAIRRHYPELAEQPQRYLELLRAVSERQARLIAQWMHVGFIHGVMNTDNMAISGETIDFGPCAFMEAYDPRTVFSSIDTHGRYAYANQPLIAQWNLARFAETLLPLIDSEQPERAVAPATEILHAFPARYDAHWLGNAASAGFAANAESAGFAAGAASAGFAAGAASAGFAAGAESAGFAAGARAKLGLTSAEEGDLALAQDWLELMRTHGADYTLAWRRLSDAAAGEAEKLAALFTQAPALEAWLTRWRERCAREDVSPAARAEVMRSVNPIYIPRNQRVEEALGAASERGDLQPFERLLAAITQPFEERAEFELYAQPAPAEVTACYKTFCGT